MWRLSLIAVLVFVQVSTARLAFSKGWTMVDQQKPKDQSVPEKEIATLGGGCFWCLEAVFEELEGVKSVVSGYSGGSVKNPSYEEVCTGTTGHAEVIQIEFDPHVIGFGDLLDVFFGIHDPTTINRQGADVGSQYRSVIFFRDARQERMAREKIKEIESSDVWKRPVVTEVVPFETFYDAEWYHQEYFARNPQAGYCRAVIVPKLSKFRAHHPDKLKEKDPE